MGISFDGLVLCGGRAARMGGADKTAMTVDRLSLREIAVAALAGAERTLVIGPDGDLLEDPPGGGPLAAIAAGLGQVSAPIVAVLAADLPFVTAEAVTALVAVAPAVAVDDQGRPQYLLAAYRTDQLRAALPTDPAGHSLRSVVDTSSVRHVRLPGVPPPWWDCDTPEDLARARRWI